MTDLYNLIAEICSSVIRACPENVFFKFTCISREANDRIREDIFRQFPFLCDTDPGSKTPDGRPQKPKVRLLEQTDHPIPDPESLSAFWQQLFDRSDFYALIVLLEVLDAALEKIIHRTFIEYQAEQYSIVLNTNREATGVGLLPRCSCVWERSSRRSGGVFHLDSFFSHLLLLDNRVLDDIVDIHHFLPDGFFRRFDTGRKLVVAATPLRFERHFVTEAYEEDRVQYFRISCEGADYSMDNALIWEKIIAAGQKGSDILVFPEMLGNPETASYITDRLKSRDPHDRSEIPSLIVLPSVWDKTRRSNTVTILDREGNILCRQSKQIPFRMNHGGSSFLEGIHSNLVVNIFHYEGIGRIAILICKDFLMTQFMERLMRSFKLTLIIVPSFSTGSYDFLQSSDLCAHDDCNVVWINSCAAMEPGKEANFRNIGYVRKRIGRSDDDALKLTVMPSCPGVFSRNCSHDCIYFETITGV